MILKSNQAICLIWTDGLISLSTAEEEIASPA